LSSLLILLNSLINEEFAIFFDVDHGERISMCNIEEIVELGCKLYLLCLLGSRRKPSLFFFNSSQELCILCSFFVS